MSQLVFAGFTDTGAHLSAIANYYWQLRAIRPHQGARRRWLYRQIAKHKAVLIADGYDAEMIRLWCRQWSRCYREESQARFQAYLQKNSGILKKTLRA